jgi:four helix bundle protein
LVREWEFGQSKIDFIHKLSIALKEANETNYWIDLLIDSDYLNNTQWESIKIESIELIKILTSIIKTSKNN